MAPFAAQFRDTRVVTFDVPGVGGSPAPALPYRFAWLARLSARLLDALGIGEVDVFGVSWGGALAQQFVHDFPGRCRSLTLAATCAGFVMVPGSLRVLIAARDPPPLRRPGAHARGRSRHLRWAAPPRSRPPRRARPGDARHHPPRLPLPDARGRRLDELALAPATAGADADPDGRRRPDRADDQRPHHRRPAARRAPRDRRLRASLHPDRPGGHRGPRSSASCAAIATAPQSATRLPPTSPITADIRG